MFGIYILDVARFPPTLDPDGDGKLEFAEVFEGFKLHYNVFMELDLDADNKLSASEMIIMADKFAENSEFQVPCQRAARPVTPALQLYFQIF